MRRFDGSLGGLVRVAPAFAHKEQYERRANQLQRV
jgi:hypothetical protein